MTLALATALALFGSPACASKAATPDVLLVTGTIEAVKRDLAAEVSGVLVARPTDRGEPVEKGQLIARVDPAMYQIRLREAEAAVQLAQANLARTLRGFREEEILAAGEQTKELEAEVANTEANLKRTQELFGNKVATPFELDAAQRAVSVTQAKLAAARQHYRKLTSGLPIEDIDAARANLAQLQASADRVRLDLARTEIRAPAKGVVTEVVREAGEYVSPGAPILTIAELSNLYCWVYLSEREVGSVRLGDEVSVRIDAYADRPFPGVVSYISPEAEFTPKSVQTREERVNLVFGVRVSVPNPDGSLKIGLPVDVEIPKRRAAEGAGPGLSGGRQ